MDGIVINPATGEVLSLSEPTEVLGGWLLEVREQEQRLRAEKLAVARELISRMDSEASYTVRVGQFELKGDGPETPTEYEALELRTALQEFVDGGVITPEALDRAVEPVTTFRARAAGLNALKRLPGSIGEGIDRHSHPKEGYERRVSVKLRDQ